MCGGDLKVFKHILVCLIIQTINLEINTYYSTLFKNINTVLNLMYKFSDSEQVKGQFHSQKASKMLY